MNVELCISKVGSIKYLFKYVCKGPDRITIEIRTPKKQTTDLSKAVSVPTIDEIQHYQDARYISASEAAWRLFSFPMKEHNPTVERLEVHLEGVILYISKKDKVFGRSLCFDFRATHIFFATILAFFEPWGSRTFLGNIRK